MTPEQQAAYVQSQTTCALIEAMGMVAANQHRLSRGESVAYDEHAFNALIERYAIHHNDVVGLFRGIQ